MKIPALESLSTTLSELRATREEYFAEISKRKLECAPIRARIQNAAPTSGNERLNRVNALLGRSTAPVVQPDDVRLQNLLVEIQDFQNAICDIDASIQIEARKAGNKLYDAVKPEVDRFGKAFAKAYVDLHAAHSAYDDIINQVEDAGGNVSTLRITPNGISHPKDSSGAYFYGMREFIDAGFLAKSDMPKVFK